MTVIVWHKGMLAHDNQVTHNANEKAKVKKFERVNGVILVRCGDVAATARLLYLYKRGVLFDQWPEFQRGNDSGMLIKLEAGKVHVLTREPVWLPAQRTEAWGSGAHYALGAISMGADAREAVQVANKHSPSCGFGVTCHRSRRAA